VRSFHVKVPAGIGLSGFDGVAELKVSAVLSKVSTSLTVSSADTPVFVMLIVNVIVPPTLVMPSKG